MTLRIALLLVAVISPLSAQTGWRLVPTTDDFTGAVDRRLVLRADTTPVAPADTAARGDRLDALVVACGHRLPGAAGRSLLMYTTEPWQVYGASAGYAELRFDGHPEALHAYVTLVDYDAIAPSGGLVSRHVAFFGAQSSLYYSPQILARVLAARTLTVTYRVIGSDYTVAFHTAGLRQALGKLPGCDWPK